MELNGEIKSVIFRSEDTGYTVLDMRVEDSVFTVVGIFPPVSEGQNIRVEGKFQTRNQYGKQLLAEKIYVSEPTKLEGIKRFLGSGLIHGMGKVTAEAVVEKFGINSLEMMRYPLELSRVKGISLKRATEFGMDYVNLQKMQNAVMFLQQLGISINMALKIYRVYGDRTELNIRKNPYMLVDDIDGIGFASADRIAGELGIERGSDYRISAAVVYALKEASIRGGHNYLPKEELIPAVCTLLTLDCENPEEKVLANIDDMVLFGDIISYDTGEHIAVMLKKNFMTERSIAARLLRLEREAADFRIDVADEVKRFEADAGFTLHENQIDAVKAAVENGVQIVTGGPGTGKTTIVKCMLHLFRNLNQRVALCAPTGRAAKRLSEATGEDAKTIHRMLDLDWKNGEGHFTFDDSTRLPLDVVIVDEVSMVDEYVFNSLLGALERGTRLVLVGDKDQLASVGAGNVLSDLIKCGKFPVSYLTQIYRQSEDSKIISNAHKINRGEMPELDNKCKDFFFEEQEGAEAICKTVLALVTKRLPSYLNMSAKDIQVLCPMKRGSAGTYRLNAELQRVINPPAPDKREIKHGEYIFREGDKVMQMQNNYQQEWSQIVSAKPTLGVDAKTANAGAKTESGATENTATQSDNMASVTGVTARNIVTKTERGTGVYNGDIGTIETINTQIMQFTVRFDDDKVAIYQYSDIEQLALAYAVTIHKAQGSEFDAVVLALDANYMLQTRNLLYTAVTRAKRAVVISGSRATIGRMIRNNETARRYSLLLNLIGDETK